MSTLYRADHVGSFLRPKEVLEARAAGTEPEKLRAIEDRHIKRVLAKQQELGFEIFTDGELRRKNFMSDFTDAVEGFDFGESVARSWDASKGAATAQVSSVTGMVAPARFSAMIARLWLNAESYEPIRPFAGRPLVMVETRFTWPKLFGLSPRELTVIESFAARAGWPVTYFLAWDSSPSTRVRAGSA